MNSLLVLLLAALFLSTKSYGWNASGHRLVAQIAYHHLTKEARRIANRYNHALDKTYKPLSFVDAAAWLDSLHSPHDRWLQQKHYIDLPFSVDGTPLIPPKKTNAISAINEARAVLNSSSAKDFAKGFSLRIVLHVLADLHQPLHAASQFSHLYPQGDKGGNLFILGKNPVATNLHPYWDKGGGFLTAKTRSKHQLKKRAAMIEKHWPCEPAKMNLNPALWAEESHQLAVTKAYRLKIGQKPDKSYQAMVKDITEQRIALAGCRLAAVLIKIGQK